MESIRSNLVISFLDWSHIIEWIELILEVKGFQFLESELVQLSLSDLSFYNFLLDFLSIRTMAKILNIRRFEWTSWIIIEFLFNQVNTSEGRFIVLPLDYSRLIFFIHALYSFSCVSLKIFIARFDRIFDINDLFLSEIFKIHVLSSANFLLIFMNLYFHFVNKGDTN